MESGRGSKMMDILENMNKEGREFTELREAGVGFFITQAMYKIWKEYLPFKVCSDVYVTTPCIHVHSHLQA